MPETERDPALNSEPALWSVRMRASKKIANARPVHISGAEGLYDEHEIVAILREYSVRAMNHPRGLPDEILFSIEMISEKPFMVPILSVRTMRCDSPAEAQTIVRSVLSATDISKKAIDEGINVITKGAVMRGASLIRARSGNRVEPSRERGVRVSRIGITRKRRRWLSGRLAKEGINTATVREALVLASKVASCNGVLAELCMSDDPDYTTGYIASSTLGYIRIPKIKERGDPRGGRIFFIREETDVDPLIVFLEEKPVIVC